MHGSKGRDLSKTIKNLRGVAVSPWDPSPCYRAVKNFSSSPPTFRLIDYAPLGLFISVSSGGTVNNG